MRKKYGLYKQFFNFCKFMSFTTAEKLVKQITLQNEFQLR